MEHTHEHHHDDIDYAEFRLSVAQHFAEVSKANFLFTTEVAPHLADAYLAAFPEGNRQHHNCNACLSFIRRYGHLVVVTDDGEMVSAFWPEATGSGLYDSVSETMRRRVQNSRITGVFYSKEAVLGTPVTGEWTHFYGKTANAKVSHPKTTLTSGQAMAARQQDMKNLRASLRDYSPEVVAQAHHLLVSGQLPRAETIRDRADWFLKAATINAVTEKGVRRAANNLLWKQVASSGPGYGAVRGSMLGTLLDDVKNGVPMARLYKNFETKIAGTAYMRPTAPVSTGQVAAAEQLVEKLGIETSLARRHANYDDVPEWLWQPPAAGPEKGRQGGVFSSLKTKDKVEVRDYGTEGVAIPMSVVKFIRTVLPDAQRIEAKVTGARQPFVAFLTAVDPDAKPILKWDSEDQRNPLSWYCHSKGSYGHQWGLGSTWYDVAGVCKNPAWMSKDISLTESSTILFAIKGCVDKDSEHTCLFPEFLKAELHEARRVIENFSKGEKRVRGDDEVAGLNAGNTPITVRVTTGHKMTTTYVLDRWD